MAALDCKTVIIDEELTPSQQAKKDSSTPQPSSPVAHSIRLVLLYLPVNHPPTHPLTFPPKNR